MASYNINIDETINLPRNRVFAVFADHTRFGKMLGAPVKRIRDSQDADPNGQGSVRKIGIGPIGAKETIITFKPDSLIEYKIIGVSPIANHFGRISFSDAGDKATRVQYTITFDDKVPFLGKLLAPVLETGIRKGIRKLPGMA